MSDPAAGRERASAPGVIVRGPGEGRTIPGPEAITLKATGEETGGSIGFLEGTTPPGAGPARHLHPAGDGPRRQERRDRARQSTRCLHPWGHGGILRGLRPVGDRTGSRHGSSRTGQGRGGAIRVRVRRTTPVAQGLDRSGGSLALLAPCRVTVALRYSRLPAIRLGRGS